LTKLGTNFADKWQPLGLYSSLVDEVLQSLFNDDDGDDYDDDDDTNCDA
jgi:hypothetical protein